ncbi:leucine-rich repeat extensin-like protein 2 [Cucurbita moschata]|uniref:Leucine-rich repeat extensin-like protein 2 n=1 Tax=Cucurbita moschata TaxID=3662 RepID=A0A6J1GAW3_CUCMO|nr:leucine-rich repeat extensin-like protein 2 [Cucurbita moschata]
MAPSAAIFLSLLLSFIQTSPPISASPLDPDTEINCDSTTLCSNPSVQQLQPSPPLPPPPLPPPRFTYTTLSSPPPPLRFIYTTGVPSDLYQNDEKNRWYYFSGAVGKPPAMAALVVVGLACGALDLIVFGKW